MHACIDCEGECDCDIDDLHHDDNSDCSGCGCDEDDWYDDDDDEDY